MTNHNSTAMAPRTFVLSWNKGLAPPIYDPSNRNEWLPIADDIASRVIVIMTPSPHQDSEIAAAIAPFGTLQLAFTMTLLQHDCSLETFESIDYLLKRLVLNALRDHAGGGMTRRSAASSSELADVFSGIQALHVVICNSTSLATTDTSLSVPDTLDIPLPSRCTRIKLILDSSTSPEYVAASKDLALLDNLVREEIAERLAGPLNAYLHTAPQDTHEQRQEIAAWVNAQLRSRHLAIRDPESGWPAILIANRGGKSGNVSRFWLQTRDQIGKTRRSMGVATLPDLVLMPDTERVEPLSRWASLARTKQTDQQTER